MLAGIARIVGFAAMGPWIDRLPPGSARAVRLAIVLVVGIVPIVLVARGSITYVDALLWLQIETVTIWAWGTVRLWSGRAVGRQGFARVFFPFHYGMFTVLPLLMTILLYVPDLRPAATGWTFLVVGLVSALAYGWSIRGHLLGRTPFGALDWAQAYARMAVSYAALFVGMPLVPHTSNGVAVTGDPSLGPLLGVLMLSLKFVVEFALFGLRERQAPSADPGSEVLTGPTVG